MLARRLMRCAIGQDAHDKVALRQEVYLDLDAGDSTSALRDIDALREQGAADAQLEAQAGYILAEKKNFKEAKAAFRRAFETGDSDIRLQSLQAIGNLGGEASPRSVSLNLDSEYLNRFDDGIVDAEVHFNQRLGKDVPVTFYLNTRLLRDTASRVGPLPQIFDDNALLVGVGVAFQPGEGHMAISAEANEAYVFYAGRDHSAATVPDFRVVAGYYRDFRPMTDGRFHVQANGSFGFYSRYQHDAIAYLQPQEGYDLVRSGPIHIEPYLQEDIALDTNQQYYNNLVEVIPGLALGLAKAGDVAVHLEYARGYYLPVHSNSVNPYGSSYNDFRVRLTWSKTIPFGRGGE